MLRNIAAIVLSDIGNIIIGVVFLLLGIVGFTLLKLSERGKNKK